MYYRSIKEVKTALPNDVRDTQKKKKTAVTLKVEVKEEILINL